MTLSTIFDPLMLHIYWPHILFALDLTIRLCLGVRIIQRRLPAGVAWAWLSLLLFVPLVGTVLYLFVGEYRMGRRRTARLLRAETELRKLSTEVSPSSVELTEPSRSVARASQSLFQTQVLPGNEIELLGGADDAFPRMIADIDSAQTSCDMEFYIWSDGGRADEFGKALIRAAGRGVRVRVLVDRIGSAQFLKGQMVEHLRQAGVEVCVALPSGVLRSLIARPDLRIHRKILVIDRQIAFTGSLNLADPVFFKRESGVGPWVDALARMRGPCVRSLHFVFLSDWAAESVAGAANVNLSDYPVFNGGPAAIQTLPSGPAIKASLIEEILVLAISAARKEIVLTTPYFVPNESLLYALTGAARRGVKVRLIVPRLVDSKLTHYASRSYLKDLLEAGVEVLLYKKGLLHTKSVAIDGEFAHFGSLNLDPRSLRINFEITVAVYDRAFTHSLRQLQDRYAADSEDHSLAACAQQGATHVFLENLARLVGPVL